MKKVFTFLLFTISFLTITACVNLNDEVITLTDGYEVAHLGDNCNIIWKNHGDNVFGDITTPNLVAVGYDEQYIVALIQPIEAMLFDQAIKCVEDDSTKVYYIIDTETDKLSGPFSKEEISNMTTISHIEIIALDELNQ